MADAPTPWPLQVVASLFGGKARKSLTPPQLPQPRAVLWHSAR